MSYTKDEHVYISDPRALHHVVVKDQYVFEETSMFLESVLSFSFKHQN